MPKSIYNLAGMHKIDALREEVERLLEQAVADCRERPGIKKARTVTLKWSLTPHPQDADDVFVDHDVTAKTPGEEQQQTHVPAPQRYSSAQGGDPMLVLSRQANESIEIGDGITVCVLEIRRGFVRIGIDADRSIPIVRSELIDWERELSCRCPDCAWFGSPDEARGGCCPECEGPCEEVAA